MMTQKQNQLETNISNATQFEVEMVNYGERKYQKLIKKNKVLKKWTENIFPR